MKSLFRGVVYKMLTSLFNREKLMFLLSKENKEELELLGFKNGGYLFDIGWTNSIITGNVVDLVNKPIPWATYPFIHFIANRLNRTLEIFEYGSGNSTLYYAERAGMVTSVENDRHWHDKIKNNMPQNVRLYYCELVYGGDYCKYALHTNVNYDIVIIDGRDRVNCCMNSIAAIKPAGVIILDDSERKEYTPAKSFLQENNFKAIDFWGTAPCVNYLKCTTIFYKPANCLNI